MKRDFLKKIKMVAAGVLASAVLLLSATPVYAGYYQDSAEDHKDISFSEIQETEIYDYDTVEASVKALMSAADKAKNDAEVEKCYRRMLSELDNLVTASALLNLDFYTHLDDEEIDKRLEKMSSDMVELGDMANAAISKMVDGEYRYLVENDIGDGAKEYENYQNMTEEEKALYAKEEALETEYERYSQDPAYEGMERYKHLAEIYIELVKVRQEMVKYSGYDSYRQYTYTEIYGRDYSIGLADGYHGYVKRYVRRLYNLVTEKILEDVATYQTMWDKDCGELTDIFTVMDNHLGEIHPELTEAYNYFKQNHMYYIENNDYMFEAGYTTKLYSYNTPFIYLALYGNFYDYSDVFHEFGHFNQMYHDNECAMYGENSFDVAEIHSQTMELFFLQWAEECYGQELADMVKLFTLYRMLDNVISGAMQDEFQAEVYRLDTKELSVDRLTEIFKDVLVGYGYSEELAYSWVDVTHTFNSPFYYISYSTSAMVALQLYEMSKTYYDMAVDTYMKLTALPGSVCFCEAMDEVGLRDIMQSGVVRDICAGLEKSYVMTEENENGGNAGGLPEGGVNSGMGLIGPMVGLIYYGMIFSLIVFLLFAVIAVIVVTVILIRRHKKRRRDGE